MKIALISVYNKEGIVEFGKQLADLGFKILASGGTAKALSAAGIEVTDVASLVGGGPILGHRVVTLSREVHAGLLAKNDEADRKELESLKIPFIDLVCGDLYPLEETIEKLRIANSGLPDKDRDEVIEKTDMGGPAMLRSAAKGRRIVVCETGDRQRVIDWLKGGEQNSEQFIAELAAKAESYVANYVLASARYLSLGKFDGLVGGQILEAKYGENGWQTPAGLYESKDADILSLNKFKVLAGTSPSYNNWADVDRLLQTITHIAAGFDVNFKQVPKIAVGVKHGNPCGAAVDENPHTVLQKMLEGDLRAIFGGVVMVNFTIDEVAAEILLSYQMPAGQRRLLDGIIAPDFAPAAVEMLKRKGDKCRFMINSGLASLTQESLDKHTRFRYVRGGFLKQPNYTFVLNFQDKAIEKTGEIDESTQKDLLLAWAVGSTSNSNTVTLVKNQMLIGNGVGQQDRVSCCQLAIKRARDANHETQGATAYSDSFFPFVDGVQVLSAAEVKAVFATSGSVRDEEIKKFCLDNGVSLVMLPDSQARGFFGH